MEGITLLKDFAIIMVAAGAITLLFRKLRQPLVLGYLIAGVLVGPYTLPLLHEADIQNISLLAELGLVLILFRMGLEFSWGKIRHVGFSILMIGVIEIVTMLSLGFGLGQLLGWTIMDSIFLGAALHISSSAIIVKLLRDMGRLKYISAKLIVGILVVEDFSAVAIIAVLSGLSTTGIVGFTDVGFVILKLGIFVVATLVLGAIVIPRIINFTHQFHSNEALLITSLGLCFAMALFSEYLGLSVAIGAFLMGSLIGDTDHHEEIVRILTPVHQMFAALFFVAIGMLINVAQFREFALPALIIAAVFILGKIFMNTAATFISGQSGKTSLQVGMGMPQMGEFSLVITRVGVENKVITPSLYPIIAVVTAITSFTTPYIVRSSDRVAAFLERNSPPLLKTYISQLADWLKELRMTFSSDTISAAIVGHAIKSIAINLLIVLIIISIGTFSLPFISDLASNIGISNDIVGLGIGCLLLLSCLPSFIAIFGNVRDFVDYAVSHLLSRRLSSKTRGLRAMQIIFRDSIVAFLTIIVALWFIPLVSGLISIGSIAIAIPVILAILVLFIVIWSAFDIHSHIERTFSRTLIGTEHISTSKVTKFTNVIRKIPGRLVDRFR